MEATTHNSKEPLEDEVLKDRDESSDLKRKDETTTCHLSVLGITRMTPLVTTHCDPKDLKDIVVGHERSEKPDVNMKEHVVNFETTHNKAVKGEGKSLARVTFDAATPKENKNHLPEPTTLESGIFASIEGTVAANDVLYLKVVEVPHEPANMFEVVKTSVEEPHCTLIRDDAEGSFERTIEIETKSTDTDRKAP